MVTFLINPRTNRYQCNFSDVTHSPRFEGETAFETNDILLEQLQKLIVEKIFAGILFVFFLITSNFVFFFVVTIRPKTKFCFEIYLFVFFFKEHHRQMRRNKEEKE